MLFHPIHAPKSSLEKTELARKLYHEFKEIRDTRDKSIWLEARLLYYLDKYGLHNYLFGKALSKAAFSSEIDLPLSTFNFKVNLYEFYVVEHGFTFEDLQEANTKKLHRALPFLKEANKEKVKEVVELAERERQSLSDFLAEVSGNDSFCTHHEKEEISEKKVVCKLCKKTLKNGKRGNRLS